jgi:hypothetical protein
MWWNGNDELVRQSSFLTTHSKLNQIQPRRLVGHHYPNKTTKIATTRFASNRTVIAPSFAKASTKANTEKAPETNCRRACGYYNNKIFLSSDGRAGLNDRLFVFESMLNLAGYLCATLHVSRPKHQLHPVHNGNVELDARMQWDEFASFNFANDQFLDTDEKLALVDWVNPTNVEEPPQRNAIYMAPQYKRWVQVFTDSPSKFIAHFQQVEEHTFARRQNRAFVWEISINFYEWSDLLSDFLMERKERRLNQTEGKSAEEQNVARTWSLMQPYIRAADSDFQRKWYWGCEYAKIEPPLHLQEMQERIVQLIYQQGPSSSSSSAPVDLSRVSDTLVGHFHIRRGDAIGECNTSLSRIEQYLDCSLGRSLPMLQTTPIGSTVKHIVILLSSDERDQQYRRAVAELVEKQQQQQQYNPQKVTVTCVDFDNLVKTAVQREIDAGTFPPWRLNNFYSYRLISGLSYNTSVFKFRLQQRRSGFSCPECTNVTEQLLVY